MTWHGRDSPGPLQTDMLCNCKYVQLQVYSVRAHSVLRARRSSLRASTQLSRPPCSTCRRRPRGAAALSAGCLLVKVHGVCGRAWLSSVMTSQQAHVLVLSLYMHGELWQRKSVFVSGASIACAALEPVHIGGGVYDSSMSQAFIWPVSAYTSCKPTGPSTLAHMAVLRAALAWMLQRSSACICCAADSPRKT